MKNLQENPQGVLPKRMLKELVPHFLSKEFESDIFQDSVDLRITDDVRRIESAFMPFCHESVAKTLKKTRSWKHSFSEPLMPGRTYIAKGGGKIRMLDDYLYSWVNPKSSIGRVFLHVRLLADGVDEYDSLPEGFKGDHWLLLRPLTFDTIIAPGMAFSQARVFASDTRLGGYQLAKIHREQGLLWKKVDGVLTPCKRLKFGERKESLILGLDLTSDIVGFHCKKTDMPLDLRREDNDPKEFFEMIERPESGSIVLEKDNYYILSTDEFVRIPPAYACEMLEMAARQGDIRAHFAGYIGPGWGFGEKGESKGSPLTMEVQPFEKAIFRGGQPIAKIGLEMMAMPAPPYRNSYTNQVGAKLSKFFAPWK